LQSAPTQSDGIVRLRRETKGRGGKGVTLIDGLPLAEDALQALARQLKNKCGTGGTVKNGTIEIQGDHRVQLQALLEALGFKVKLAGG
jgi:translation initiation factor 1